MPAPERLQVGAVGEGDLDLDENVAWAGARIGHFLDADVPGAVEDQRPHGVKTILSTSPLR